MRIARRCRCVTALVASGLAACAAIVSLTVHSRNAATPPLEHLKEAAASMPDRPARGRLSDFPYAPYQRNATSFPSTSRNQILETPHDNPASRHALAIVLLSAGRAAQAEKILTQLASIERSPKIWNDLAATRIELGARTNDVGTYVLALAAARRALEQEPRMTEALFNYTLALQELGLRSRAAIGLRRYLAIDSDSAWADEVRSRLSVCNRASVLRRWEGAAKSLSDTVSSAHIDGLVCTFPEQARRTAESDYLTRWADNDAASAHWLSVARTIGQSLARRSGERLLLETVAAIDRVQMQHAAAAVRDLRKAHIEYRRGRKLYDARKVRDSIAPLQSSERLFAKHDSPMKYVAAYYSANAISDEGDSQAALAILDETRRRAAPAFIALHAQIEWQRALIFARVGRFHDAIECLSDAIAGFDRLGELANATTLRSSAASAASTLGRTDEAWEIRWRVFRDADAIGDSRLIERVLHEAARDELRAQHDEAASALFDVELSAPSSSIRYRVDALLRRAMLTHNSDVHRLDELERMASALPDLALRAEALDDLRLARAIRIRKEDPHASASLITETISFRRARRMEFSIASALVERAISLRAARRNAEASTDFSEALTIIESQRAAVTEAQMRDVYLADDRAYREALDFYAENGDDQRAFDIAERSRARLFMERAGRVTPASPEVIARQLPRGTMIIEYSTGDINMTIHTVSASGFHARRDVSTAAVRDALDRFNDARQKRSAAGIERAIAILYRHLIEPVGDLRGADTLIIVPDRATSSIPFAILHPVDMPYLTERARVIIAPTATSAVSARRARTAPPPNDVVVIADPAFDPSHFANMPRLANAAREGVEIVRLYKNGRVLSGTEATCPTVETAMKGWSVIHFAAHALSDGRDGRFSFLLLAPSSRDTGVLYAPEISKLPLQQHPLVVLAGCGTATPGKGWESTRSLALAFLAAGSRSVIGTLWDVDDEVARAFGLRFHSRLAGGAPAATALRDAQLAMMRSPDARLRAPAAWGAFQLYGYASSGKEN